MNFGGKSRGVRSSRLVDESPLSNIRRGLFYGSAAALGIGALHGIGYAQHMDMIVDHFNVQIISRTPELLSGILGYIIGRDHLWPQLDYTPYTSFKALREVGHTLKKLGCAIVIVGAVSGVHTLGKVSGYHLYSHFNNQPQIENVRQLDKL